MEDWKNLDKYGFIDYSVSDHGNVRNDITGRILKQSATQSGGIKVGMIRDGKQHTVSVAKLVASSFLPNEYDPSIYDTPINKDGNRSNNSVDNLIWRPRWFAMQYHLQFIHNRYWCDGPIEVIETNERFLNSYDIAVTYGLLAKDILFNLTNGHPVFAFPYNFGFIRPIIKKY